ncbi:transcriptional regulator [Enterobacter soli]|uniref:winged helix-turn-helix domain-containing protein n=1 Tax=Enterobacter soli TaxID=885040 RepID=UPI003EDB6138
MFWIINDNIKFYPDKNKLISVSKPDLSVIITAPAGRCLRLLLESAPEVVNQKDFFTYVWAEDGMLVPANTLYQNISIIRRGLRSTGETDETLISTVPRKGFQIASGIKVTRVEKNDDLSQNEEDFQAQHDEFIPAPVKTPTEIPTVKVDKKVGARYSFSLTVLMLLVSLGLGVSVSLLPWHQHPAKDFFNAYTISRTEDGCHFLSQNDDLKKRGNFSKFKNLIVQTGLDCKKYPWIYFSSSSTAPALSAFICKEPYEKPSNTGCVTLYFRWNKL